MTEHPDPPASPSLEPSTQSQPLAPQAMPPPAPPAPPAYGPAGAPTVGPAAGELAIKRSVVRCAVASILSFGVYGLWWFYQYRKRLNAELSKNDDAGLHTLGLFVPFLNYYLTYLLWKDISDVRTRVGLREVPAVGYIVGAIFIAPLFYGLVNADLNEYWDRRTGGRAVDAPWTTGEKLATFVPMVVFGGFFLILIIIAIGIAASAGRS